MIEHRQPDSARGDFAAREPQLVLDRQRQLFDLLLADRPTFARRAHPVDDLVAVEGLGAAAGLDDDQRHLLDTLEGGEAVRAREALPAAPDGGALLGQARVDHLGVVGLADSGNARRQDTDPCVATPAASGQGRRRLWPTWMVGPPLRSTSVST